MVVLYILDILRQSTDENHRLSQKRIKAELFSHYGVKIARGTLSTYLKELRSHGYISGERGLYLNRHFSDEEVRVLIDSVLFGHFLPQAKAQEMIQKLQYLGSPQIEKKVQAINDLYAMNPNNNEHLYEVMEALDTAIENHRQVRITSCRYGIDKQLHPTSVRIVDPYYVVSDMSRFYLICHNANSDELGNRRLDRMAKVEVLESVRTPIRSLTPYLQGFDLSVYMAEHIYMFAGASEVCTLKLKKDHIGDFIDWYGFDFRIEAEAEDDVIIVAKINTQALYYWILQYGEIVEVLGPASLVTKIRNGLEQLLEKYKQ